MKAKYKLGTLVKFAQQGGAYSEEYYSEISGITTKKDGFSYQVFSGENLEESQILAAYKQITIAKRREKRPSQDVTAADCLQG